MNRVVSSRRSSLLLGGLVLGHAIVISGQVDGGGGVSLLERGLLLAIAPVQHLVAATTSGVASVWTGYLDLRGVHQKNQRLEARVRVLEMQLQEKETEAREAERLRGLLDLRRRLPFKTLPAEIISRGSLPWFRTLTLGKGARDGVRLDDAVVDTAGVLGRVIALGPHVARVQLLTDRDSGVGVLVERTRVGGVVSGQLGPSEEAGSLDLVLNYVPTTADVAVGDVVITSGQDRVYPKGLVVGRVRSVAQGSGLFKEILVTPSARFRAAEEALVIRGEPKALVFEETVQ